MGNIGKPIRRVELEPIEAPAEEPVAEPAPEREPEEVPA